MATGAATDLFVTQDAAELFEEIVRAAATTMHGDINLAHPGEALAHPTVWLFGNEAHGLDPEIMDAADHRLSIPIHGNAESLNLATAAAICL